MYGPAASGTAPPGNGDPLGTGAHHCAVHEPTQLYGWVLTVGPDGRGAPSGQSAKWGPKMRGDLWVHLMVLASAPSTSCVSSTTGGAGTPQSEGSLAGRMCQAARLPLHRPPAARGSSAHPSESQSQVQLSHKEAEALRLSVLLTGLGCEQPESRIRVHIIPLSPLSP